MGSKSSPWNMLSFPFPVVKLFFKQFLYISDFIFRFSVPVTVNLAVKFDLLTETLFRPHATI